MSKPTLLISVFNAEEVRAAIAGGAEIIDCEDPQADLGMFEPRVITNIAYAVRQSYYANVIPTSANIGYNLTLFRRNAMGYADIRMDVELKAKAAQEALGLAAAMDVGDGRANIVKVGAVGLRPEQVVPIISSVKNALRNSRQFQNHKVVCGFREIDRNVWLQRKGSRQVIKQMLDLGEFYFTREGQLNLNDFYSEELVRALMQNRSDHPQVEINDPIFPEELGYPSDINKRLTTYVDLIDQTGADGVMLDTPIQAKLSDICLIDDASNASGSLNSDDFALHGLFPLNTVEFFTDYCAYLELESYLAGSITPTQLRKLSTFRNLDVVLFRGAASDVVTVPGGASGSRDRVSKRISESKVRALYEAVKGE